MKKMRIILLALAVGTASLGIWGCGNQSESSFPQAKESQVVELKDADTYDLVAGPVEKKIGGQIFKMLAYNGSIPGPLIKVQQGAEVTINLKNDTDVKTLLHSHGVRMENAFDGSQGNQKEMEPGETFAYKLTFPDAGMYWYHPHVSEAYAQDLGLYGNYWVVPKNKDYWPPVNREVPIFLDDILIENGAIAANKTKTDRTLMGRFGNVMLVNGEENFVLNAKKDEVVRLYLTNAANTRPFNFAIQGEKLKLVGGDNGAYEKASFVDSVRLGPSERAIVDVLVTQPATLLNQTPEGTTSLGSIAVEAGALENSYEKEFNQLQANQGTVASIDPFRPYFDKEPDKKIRLSIDMGGGMMNMGGTVSGGHRMPDGTMMGGMMMGTSPDGIEWEDPNPAMNQASNTDSTKWKIIDEETGKENMDIDWEFQRGQPVKIRISNDPHSMHPMQHPIHFHGQRFLVVARNGVEETNLAWKDTVLVPAGQTVDIVLDPSNPGTWMAHCHIAEHLESGMMFGFKVE